MGAAGAGGRTMRRDDQRYQSSPDSPSDWGSAALLTRDQPPDTPSC
jgi:hypothetical protein